MKMTQYTILMVAALLGALAVGLGAFGAHALKSTLEANGRLDTYELAVRYQFYHVMALLATGILVDKFPLLSLSAWLFIVGIIVFSGSLYTLALTGQKWWGAVTPMGGVAFIAGWLYFLWAVYKAR